MELAERLQRYRAIESFRERPLIVYATSTRGNVPSMMAGDAVREFIDQIDAIPNGDSVDVLIHSTGGDALAAWTLMSILRERFSKIGVLVPFMAYSAATIFSLGADEIVMHPRASLGPIDPQIPLRQADGTVRFFSFEDVGAFLRFLVDEIGITEQDQKTSVIDKLFSVVDPVHIGGAKRASELSTDVGERLLQTHMTGVEEKARARGIAEGLNKSFFAHGDSVLRSRARQLQLRVAADNPALEKLIWDAYLGLESYMELRTPFQALDFFIANGGGPAIAPRPPINLPANAPEQLVNQIWNQVGQNALQALGQPAIEVQYEVVNAIVESRRAASEYRTVGNITAARVVGGEVRISATTVRSGWRNVPIQPPAPGAQEPVQEVPVPAAQQANAPGGPEVPPPAAAEVEIPGQA